MPERELLLTGRFNGRIGAQAAVRLTTIRTPFDAERIRFARFELNVVLTCIRIPCRAPYLVRERLAIDEDTLVARIIMAELILARLARSDGTFVGHSSRSEGELREVLTRKDILEIDGVFSAYERLCARCRIGAGEGSGLAILICDIKHSVQLAVGQWVAESAERIGIEEDAVALTGEDKRKRHLGVVLEEFFVSPLPVPLIALVLS